MGVGLKKWRQGSTPRLGYLLVSATAIDAAHSWMLWWNKLSANAALCCIDRAGMLMTSTCPLSSLQKENTGCLLLSVALCCLNLVVCLYAVLANTSGFQKGVCWISIHLSYTIFPEKKHAFLPKILVAKVLIWPNPKGSTVTFLIQSS